MGEFFKRWFVSADDLRKAGEGLPILRSGGVRTRALFGVILVALSLLGMVTIFVSAWFLDPLFGNNLFGFFASHPLLVLAASLILSIPLSLRGLVDLKRNLERDADGDS